MQTELQKKKELKIVCISVETVTENRTYLYHPEEPTGLFWSYSANTANKQNVVQSIQ